MTPLIVLETEDGVVLLTREQLKRRVRHDLEGADLVAELLDARRTASAAEDQAAV
jgi:UDP-N-acetyl-D-mannosaminuronic acid transferase (WecB/TagA/CpsF family)